MPSIEQYMRRALQLAAFGYGYTYTNPMVGAVIVASDGRIIGQGWHRRFGGPHAEVNAVRSVAPADRKLLHDSTIYVTLEPCSHYGKTPPCAQLLIDEGIPRIVIGASDPFPSVAGRGIRMLRDAGREVITGVLAEECRDLNYPFMRAHELGRVYVTLKWAQSADGYIAASAPDTPLCTPVIISNPVSALSVHRLRASCQGIMVGVNTVITDNPHLGCRLWSAGDRPRPVTFDSPRLPKNARIFERNPILRGSDESLSDFLSRLYREYKFNHLLVEGGRLTLQEFIDSGLYDSLRIEISPRLLSHGIAAPSWDPSKLTLRSTELCGENTVLTYIR